MKQLPPVLDAMAGGFKIVSQTITESILKLATPQVILGITGLAGAFFMLAGALVSVASAGLVAMPAMAAVTGFTAAMTALGAISGAGAEQSENEALKIELEAIKTHLQTLVEGFAASGDKDYIKGLGNVVKGVKLNVGTPTKI